MHNVPYQPQNDNVGGTGWRECFSSSVAMLCIHLGAIRSDDAYNVVRRGFGDTTNVAAHVAAVRKLGLQPFFSQAWSRKLLEGYLRTQGPVAVGWLHHGHVNRPTGGGHWSVIVGFTDRHVIMHDPYGEPDLVGGGHIRGRSGRAVPCTWANWSRRWLVEGPSSGWVFTVRR